MKKVSQNRKLNIRREQIARLGETELRNVVGGVGISLVGNPCNTTQVSGDTNG